jgi:hypothetical protein
MNMVINGLKLFFGIPILLMPFELGFSMVTAIIGIAGIWLILSGFEGLIACFLR